ncbi:MAG TPA: hypothetical protein VFS00_25280 [Polyangiaceae bacterium]|nr:hypothetical protein [Polyangiaceae bacterium]
MPDLAEAATTSRGPLAPGITWVGKSDSLELRYEDVERTNMVDGATPPWCRAGR